MSERGALILASLAGGPKHGYALIKDVQDFAGIRLGPGTLYGCLTTLEEAGLIESLPPVDRRLPYRITAAGSERLRAQLEESARIAQTGLARLQGGLA